MLILGIGNLVPVIPANAASQYEYRIADKSPDASIKAGESIVLWTILENTGYANWELEGSAHPIRLGTTDPQDRVSQFRYAEKWVSGNRIRATERNGNRYDFGFHIQAPSNLPSGAYRECFYPVLENESWIYGEEICWYIHVAGQANNYQAEPIDDYINVDIDQGESQVVELAVKNTGNQTWYQSGSFPVHLGTIRPRDRSSEFYDASWLNYNRPAELSETSVPPGATGHFEFTITADDDLPAQMYYEKFWLVAENLQWFDENYTLVGAIPLTLNIDVNDVDNPDDDAEFSQNYSNIDASQEKIDADGDDESQIEVELRDKNDDPIKYVWVDLIGKEIDVYDREESYFEYTIRTDEDGIATYDFSTRTVADYEFTFAYNNEESDDSVMVKSYDKDDDNDKDFSDEFSRIEINKSYIEPDGDEEARIDILVRDHDDDPIKNDDIELIILERETDENDWYESDRRLETDSRGEADWDFTTSREADYWFTFEYNGDRFRDWVDLSSYEDNDDDKNNDFDPDNSYIEANRSRAKANDSDYILIEIGVHDEDDDPMEDKKVIIYGEECNLDGSDCDDIDDIVTYTDSSGVVEYKFRHHREAQFELTYEVNDERSRQYVTIEFYEDDNDDDYDTDNEYDVPVLSLSYIPLDNRDDVDVDLMEYWDNDSLYDLEDHIDDSNQDLMRYLEMGSEYHGYDDSWADTALDYFLVDEIQIEDELPESDRFEWPGTNDAMVDYFDILEDEVDICDYVDHDGVKEVWLWSYYPRSDEPMSWQSNMSMGYDIEGHWNYTTYGNVSNSEQEKDMPICDNTYTLFTHYYGQDLGESLASHTRQMETVLNYIDYRNDTSASDRINLLFWGDFVGSDYTEKIINPGCGSTDYAPNSNQKFDYDNTDEVKSNCEDWEPDGGREEYISCETWGGSGCDKYEEDGNNVAYLVWWMQNLPGRDNDLYDNDEKIKNWWDFIGDFENAIGDRDLTY